MTDIPSAERVAQLRAALSEHGQEHVLRFADELSPDALDALLSELEALDLPRLDLRLKSVLGESHEDTSGELEPPRVVELDNSEAGRARDTAAREAGEELLRTGKVAAFLVAGGQGTRLGYAGPKGRFPVGPLTNRSLFAYHAQRVLAASRRYGNALPYYVMTSRANHADTVAAFEEASYWGLDREQVFFLTQGMLPAVDDQGRMLLAEKGALALSPDGHGGCFEALQRSGALHDMARRGVEQIFYFQVDNPLAPVFDPVFIGHHAQAGAEMSTKVVEKLDPDEKVGVLGRRGGVDCLLEYSDLDPAIASARDDNGKLRYRAGNIAIHMLQRAFAERLVNGELELPVHRANKKVPHVDSAGARVEPSEPNAIKLEMFVFDALGFAATTLVQEVRREDEFAPVKNAEGNDSPATSRAALSAQAKRWMTQAGLHVRDGDVEVGPLFALDVEAFCATLTGADFGPVFDRS
ncbi:MAG: UDP-N-acetylhexosamine pyrophosphorylase [Planctomycetota bacterium]|nr:MAG: UDP-N-acetylhexosamine pyrophosphorylase [Planctomycetota bacterium]